MPRFFTHIRVGLDLIKDAEGSELDTLEAAQAEALQRAHEVATDLISAGQSFEGVKIEVADQTGRTVHVVACDELHPDLFEEKRAKSTSQDNPSPSQ